MAIFYFDEVRLRDDVFRDFRPAIRILAALYYNKLPRFRNSGNVRSRRAQSYVGACDLFSLLRLIVTTIRPTLFRCIGLYLRRRRYVNTNDYRPRAEVFLKREIQQRLAVEDPTEETRNKFRLRRISAHADFELRVEPWRVFYRVQPELVIVELIGRKRGNALLINGKEFEL